MIVVLGLPRSGTSIVAGILHHLGVFMGERLQPPNTWNPKGSFEDLDFVVQHVTAIGSFRTAHDNLPQPPEQMPQEWHDLIAKREAMHKLWGFKCSHTPFTFHLLSKPKVILTSRPFEESVQSWMERAGWQPTREQTEKVLRHYQKQIESLNLSDALIVNHADIYEKTTDTVNRIADFIGVHPTINASNWIEPNLRRIGG